MKGGKSQRGWRTPEHGPAALLTGLPWAPAGSLTLTLQAWRNPHGSAPVLCLDGGCWRGVSMGLVAVGAGASESFPCSWDSSCRRVALSRLDMRALALS